MQSKRRLPKFSLLTAVVCIFLAGILLALNVVPRQLNLTHGGPEEPLYSVFQDLSAFSDRGWGVFQRGWPFYFLKYDPNFDLVPRTTYIDDFRPGFLLLDVMICCGIVFLFGVVFEWLVQSVRKQLR